jgi:hypothetical protein
MHFKKVIIVLTILLTINIITVTFGSDKSKITVFNRTDYYLHFFIDGTQYLFIAPERSVTHETDAKPTIIVTAFYAPGQGVKGSITDTVSVPYRSAVTGCSCEEGNIVGECSYTPPAGGSANHEITADRIPTEVID